MAINLKYPRSMLLMRFSRVVNFFFLGYNIFTSYPANLSASVDPSAKANQQARSSKAQRNARRVDLSTGHGPSNSKPCIALTPSFASTYLFLCSLLKHCSRFFPVPFDYILPSLTFSSSFFLLLNH